MGSSGGGNYRAPDMPTPAGLNVPYGQTAPFDPSYVSFLGDPSVPSTGLTPEMLQQISSGAYQQPLQASQAGAAALMQAMQQPQQKNPRDKLSQMMTWRKQFYPSSSQGAKRDSGGGSDRGGYGSSGRR